MRHDLYVYATFDLAVPKLNIVDVHAWHGVEWVVRHDPYMYATFELRFLPSFPLVFM